MVPTIHQCLCEIVFVKRVNNIIFVEIRIVCGSHSEAETQVGFIIFYIYLILDFRMVVALTSSTVHDIEFKGFQLST